MRAFALLSLALLLPGCMTISATKTVRIEPAENEKVVFVQADAQTVCRDYVFFRRCTLTVDARQIK